MRLLDEHGDEIEADLRREYHGVDLLDFYRGEMSARTLGVLVGQLSARSGLARALNGGRAPFTQTDHLLADLWVVTVKANSRKNSPGSRVTDHPTRADMEALVKTAAKNAKVVELRAYYEKRKRAYGLG